MRKQLTALDPASIDESTDLSILRRVVRKRIKGLSDEEARVTLRGDADELERWLSTPGLPDRQLFFVLPILPDAIEILLTEQPQSPPERGEATMELPEGAKMTVENGCLSVKWRRLYLFLYPSHREDMHREAGRFKDDAKKQPTVDGNGMTATEVRFGEVVGIKCVSKMESAKFKRVNYALDVPGGHLVVVLDSLRGDFGESELEAHFHTLRVLNYPPPTKKGANVASS